MSERKKLTKQQVIDRAYKVHGDKYIYDKLIYVDYHTKVIIICPTHGEFLQSPAMHLCGNGCKKCANEKSAKMRSLTLEEFIKRGNEIHGQYSYDKFIYVNFDTKGIIICPIHGEFKQTPSGHLSGMGCNKCGNIKKGRKKFTEDGFKEEGTRVHNGKYIYGKVNYVNITTKIIIICPIHGEFLQSPWDHLKGHGCRRCGSQKTGLLKALTKEKFIKRANKIHGQYIYDKFIYVNVNTKGIVICPTHGEFLQDPEHHLRGYGCDKCGKNKAKEKLSGTIEEFIEKGNLRYNGKFDYSKSIYVNCDTKLIIICPIHGEFLQTPWNHLHSNGCKLCSSGVSNKSQVWLDSLNNPNIIREHRIWIGNKLYKVDGYDPITKTAFEFNGDYWHGNPNKFSADKMNLKNKKTFGELLNETEKKKNDLISAGYEVISIWEEEFDKL